MHFLILGSDKKVWLCLHWSMVLYPISFLRFIVSYATLSLCFFSAFLSSSVFFFLHLMCLCLWKQPSQYFLSSYVVSVYLHPIRFGWCLLIIFNLHFIITELWSQFTTAPGSSLLCSILYLNLSLTMYLKVFPGLYLLPFGLLQFLPFTLFDQKISLVVFS